MVMRASEMPGATARRVAAPAVPRPWKASMMPMTVPRRPMKGATAAMVASHVMRCSMLVRASLDAIWAARSRASGLRGMPRPPDWRRYSSLISLKTGTSGLGLNWSERAAISERRPDWRKARRKRLLWVCSSAEARPLHEHDGPGEDAGGEQDDKDGEGYRAGVVDHLHEGAAAGGCGSGGGSSRVVLKEEQG